MGQCESSVQKSLFGNMFKRTGQVSSPRSSDSDSLKVVGGLTESAHLVCMLPAPPPCSNPSDQNTTCWRIFPEIKSEPYTRAAAKQTHEDLLPARAQNLKVGFFPSLYF